MGRKHKHEETLKKILANSDLVKQLKNTSSTFKKKNLIKSISNDVDVTPYLIRITNEAIGYIPLSKTKKNKDTQNIKDIDKPEVDKNSIKEKDSHSFKVILVTEKDKDVLVELCNKLEVITKENETLRKSNENLKEKYLTFQKQSQKDSISLDIANLANKEAFSLGIKDLYKIKSINQEARLVSINSEILLQATELIETHKLIDLKTLVSNNIALETAIVETVLMALNYYFYN